MIIHTRHLYLNRILSIVQVNISKSDAKVNVQFWLDRGKSILSSDELEMYELALLGGIVIDPEVFKYVFNWVIQTQ